MRKIYSLVLMVTALLIGTNAWADGVIENVRTGVQYEHLKAALAEAQDGDVLELTGNMTETQTDGIAWLGEATSGTLQNYASTDRSITLDLKGHLYSLSGESNYKIALTRGVLRIKSTGGEGEITSNKSVIAVYGTYLKIDPKNGTPFAHLIIEENVKITSGKKGGGKAEYNAIVLNTPLSPYEVTGSGNWGWSSYPCDYNCYIYPTSQWGVSNGARIDIYGKLEGDKYAFQVSGNIRTSREYLNENGSYNTSKGHFPLYWKKPNTSTELYFPGTTTDGKTASGSAYYDTNIDNADYVLTAADDDYTGYIHIHPTAELKTQNPDVAKSVGFYSSGYARCYIEGKCEGSTGVYVKAGDVELHDATVVSNWESEYQGAANDNSTSGVNAGGSAIVIESKDGWTGNIEVTISGDTHVSTDHGYAIDEQVTTGGTNVNYLTITGGTFEGGQIPVKDEQGQTTGYTTGTMFVSQPTLDAHHDPDTITTITILGAEVGGNNMIGDEENQTTLADFLAGQTGTHVTFVEDEQGNTTMIVSQGEAPETYEDPVDPTAPTPWSWCADEEQSGKNVAWTKIENAEIASGTVILGELQINSGSLLEGYQQLTINNGATLQVERLIMNAYARIIVKAGGKLIVKGTQGISAPSVENIKLEASETAQALFLFHPEVSSNRHPNATVEFISNSITANPFFSKQRFGIPTWKKLSSITTKNGGNNVQTAIASYSFEAHDWIDVSWINVPTKDENLNLIANPFEYYQMQHNTANAGTVVTMKGELYGNTNPTLSILGNSWNGYANSYMAPIDGATLIGLIPDEVDKSFQIYVLDNGAKGHWAPVSNLDLADIRPMQAFLIGNTKEAANVTVDYWDAVYTPITHEAKPAPNAAPVRRSALSNITKAKMIVRGEGYTDGVVLAQDDQFSAEFDNSYDCRKYMNEGINLYVSADEKMGIYATDNLENTYVGFQSVNGGTFTIEFINVQGEELTLIDHETGAQVLVVEGNTYAFTANGTNDYRFEIVKTHEVATAIENTEAVKSTKGIYTITGQYVGEMNVWNSLPAGIYVIDGAKRVK